MSARPGAKLRRRRGVRALVPALLCLPALCLAPPARAEAPWWHLSSGARPTYLHAEAGAPEGQGKQEIYVTAENVGDAPVDGASAPVKLKDVLPEGLRAVEIAATKPHVEGDFHHREPIACELATLTCTLEEGLAPYDQVEMRIAVRVRPGARSGESNEVSISGGGAPRATIARAVAISAGAVPFGVEGYEVGLEEEGGEPAVQAGAHPFQLTATIAFDQLADINPLVTPPEFRPEVEPAGLLKDLSLRLPPGLVANSAQIPRCTIAQFFEAGKSENRCPPDTAVGVAATTVHEPANVGTVTIAEPVFNLEPRAGEPARFGFIAAEAGTPVTIDAALRSGGDYGITASIENVTQTAGLLSSAITLWGAPGDPRHDGQRGWGCLAAARGAPTVQACIPSAGEGLAPLLSLPTSCRSAMKTSAVADSWSSPSSAIEAPGAFSPDGPPQGCDRVPFGPALEVASDTHEASTPMGLTIGVHVPSHPGGEEDLSSSAIRAIEVLLPEGVAVNPSLADGLQTCSEGEVGLLPGTGEQGELLFGPGLPQPVCPDASKIGTARIASPLLPAGQALEGGLYLATPAPGGEAGRNPFGSLVSIYAVVQDPVSGTLVELPASASLDPGSGRMTLRFDASPQIPIEGVDLELFGGPRAALASPARCGTHTSEARFVPWSGTPSVSSSASFQILAGPAGGPCPGASLPFAPSLAAGASESRAGAFSPFVATISRKDGEQEIRALQLRLPPGVSAILRGVQACPTARADAGTCGPDSLIGHAKIGVGVGPDPLGVAGGEAFLTAGHGGAPFGLSIVARALVGPFDLGRIAIGAKVELDPRSGALVVSTDGLGPYAIPRILDGVPLQLRYFELLLDRPGFTFNPTSCAARQIAATVEGSEGTRSQLAAPFRAVGCAHLRFAPAIGAWSAGKASRAGGASLRVKLTGVGGPGSGYANLAKVSVSLPRRLSARLSTLQQACSARVFARDPASCPRESIVGGARLLTPLLRSALAGPVYFVSHGGEAFPELTLLLRGDGVTVELAGSTQIKGGIVSAIFEAMPDVPFGSFELNLPRGRHSVLGASAGLCGSKPYLTAGLQGQNGAEVKRRVPIAITGCRKVAIAGRSRSKALASCRRRSSSTRRTTCEARVRRRLSESHKPGSRSA